MEQTSSNLLVHIIKKTGTNQSEDHTKINLSKRFTMSIWMLLVQKKRIICFTQNILQEKNINSIIDKSSLAIAEELFY